MTTPSTSDYRRGGAPGRTRKPRSAGDASEATPVQQRPVQIAQLVVPGHIEFSMGGRPYAVNVSESDIEPGTVANWVTCMVCEATWNGRFLKDGRPEIDGGLLRVKVHYDLRRRAAVMVRCRCTAGQRLTWARDATDHEWQLVLRYNRARLMRGLRIISTATIMKYLIDPRGASFAAAWNSHVQRLTQKGVPSDRALRRAYVAALGEVER